MFNYKIKSSDIVRDRDTTVIVAIEVDVVKCEPKLIREQWLTAEKQKVHLMVDSEENRRALQALSEARVQRALADAVIDRAVKERVIDRLGTRNRYAGKCHGTGKPVAEGIGFIGINPNTNKKVVYSFAYLCDRFLTDVRNDPHALHFD